MAEKKEETKAVDDAVKTEVEKKTLWSRITGFLVETFAGGAKLAATVVVALLMLVVTIVIASYVSGPASASAPNVVIMHANGVKTQARLEPGVEYLVSVVESAGEQPSFYYRVADKDITYSLANGKLYRVEKGWLWDSSSELNVVNTKK